MKKKHFIASILLTAILISGCENSVDDTDVFNNTTAEASHGTVTSETTTKTDVVTVEIIPGAFSEFTPPLLSFELKGIDFTGLPNGTKDLFEKAVNIWCIYYIDSMLTDENTAETITMPINDSSFIYYKTGISYDSFDVYLKSTFTYDYIDALTKTNATFINNFDELLCLDVKGVINSDFSSMTFEITEQADNFISFTGFAKYIADDGYTYEKELTQRLHLVDGEWRLSEFNCWY